MHGPEAPGKQLVQECVAVQRETTTTMSPFAAPASSRTEVTSTLADGPSNVSELAVSDSGRASINVTSHAERPCEESAVLANTATLSTIGNVSRANSICIAVALEGTG